MSTEAAAVDLAGHTGSGEVTVVRTLVVAENLKSTDAREVNARSLRPSPGGPAGAGRLERQSQRARRLALSFQSEVPTGSATKKEGNSDGTNVTMGGSSGTRVKVFFFLKCGSKHSGFPNLKGLSTETPCHHAVRAEDLRGMGLQARLADSGLGEGVPLPAVGAGGGR